MLFPLDFCFFGVVEVGSKIKAVETSRKQLIALEVGVVKEEQSGFRKLLFVAVFESTSGSLTKSSFLKK